jgi:cytochrome c oxidase subunit 1
MAALRLLDQPQGHRHDYLVFAVIAGVIGAAMSVMIRIELMYPGVQFFHETHTYNGPVTSHGLIMIFFMVMPAMIGGFGNWFVPLMIVRARHGVPRMNNISFWLLPPLRVAVDLDLVEGEPRQRRRRGLDHHPPPPALAIRGRRSISILSLHLAGASILGAINFITTIFNMRAPGMTLQDAAVRVVDPVTCSCCCCRCRLAGAITMPLTDRNFGTTRADGGGERYSYLFWFFGHPEV